MAELLKICEQGNVQQLQEYVVRCPIHVKVARDKDRLCAALHVAAGNGHDHAVAFLLGLGADVNCCNNYGWTPLMQAARNGHTSAVLLLLSQGAQADVRNRFGATAFTCAVRSGHVSTVHAILSNGCCWSKSENPVDGPPIELTAMMVAANLGHDPIVRLLLDYGFDVNQSSHTLGVTPLIMAAAGGRARTMQILIERGADVTATSQGGRTALDVAIVCKRRQVRCILEQKLADIKLQRSVQKKFNIFEAMQSGRLDEVRTALSKDSKIITNCRSVDGLTPLMFASQVGDSALIELLVNAGAELDSTDTASGWTALMFALFRGPLAQYTNRRTDILAHVPCGRFVRFGDKTTALQSFANAHLLQQHYFLSPATRHNEIALQLLQAGACVNIRTHGGFVAFDIATTIGTVKPELVVLIARETEDKFLHPLANIVRHDEPDMRLSVPRGKSKNIYESLGKTLGHLWPSKHRQRTDDVATLRPISGSSSMPQMSALNLDTKDPVKRAPCIESESSGGTTLPIISASPCRWALSKSPVRPVPPLLPSQSFDASISAGNINMSLHLPVSHSVIANNGNASEKRFDMENILDDHASTPVFTSGEAVPDALLAILEKHSLDQWKSVFDDEEVDLAAFKLLTEADLISLGFKETSVQNGFLQAIAELNQ